jgi:hypothetical protein
MKNEALKYVTLSRTLRKSQKVNSYDTAQQREADTLAHAFIDMQEAFAEIADKYLPQLFREDLDEQQINDILLDIGEELRHILYHIYAPRFYTYLRIAYADSADTP